SCRGGRGGGLRALLERDHRSLLPALGDDRASPRRRAGPGALGTARDGGVVAGMGIDPVGPRSETGHEPARGGGQARAILLIINPADRGGRAGREWPRLAAEIRSVGIEFEEACTARPGGATEM